MSQIINFLIHLHSVDTSHQLLTGLFLIKNINTKILSCVI